MMADRLYTLHVIAYNDYLDGLDIESAANLYEAIGILITAVVAAVMEVSACAWMAHASEREKQSRIEGGAFAARRTHNIIVGFVCHELRNPVMS
jgi:hypothetical protein